MSNNNKIGAKSIKSGVAKENIRVKCKNNRFNNDSYKVALVREELEEKLGRSIEANEKAFLNRGCSHGSFRKDSPIDENHPHQSKKYKSEGSFAIVEREEKIDNHREDSIKNTDNMSLSFSSESFNSLSQQSLNGYSSPSEQSLYEDTRSQDYSYEKYDFSIEENSHTSSPQVSYKEWKKVYKNENSKNGIDEEFLECNEELSDECIEGLSEICIEGLSDECNEELSEECNKNLSEECDKDLSEESNKVLSEESNKNLSEEYNEESLGVYSEELSDAYNEDISGNNQKNNKVELSEEEIEEYEETLVGEMEEENDDFDESDDCYAPLITKQTKNVEYQNLKERFFERIYNENEENIERDGKSKCEGPKGDFENYYYRKMLEEVLKRNEELKKEELTKRNLTKKEDLAKREGLVKREELETAKSKNFSKREKLGNKEKLSRKEELSRKKGLLRIEELSGKKGLLRKEELKSTKKEKLPRKESSKNESLRKEELSKNERLSKTGLSKIEKISRKYSKTENLSTKDHFTSRDKSKKNSPAKILTVQKPTKSKQQVSKDEEKYPNKINDDNTKITLTPNELTELKALLTKFLLEYSLDSKKFDQFLNNCKILTEPKVKNHIDVLAMEVRKCLVSKMVEIEKEIVNLRSLLLYHWNEEYNDQIDASKNECKIDQVNNKYENVYKPQPKPRLKLGKNKLVKLHGDCNSLGLVPYHEIDEEWVDSDFKSKDCASENLFREDGLFTNNDSQRSYNFSVSDSQKSHSESQKNLSDSSQDSSREDGLYKNDSQKNLNDSQMDYNDFQRIQNSQNKKSDNSTKQNSRNPHTQSKKTVTFSSQNSLKQEKNFQRYHSNYSKGNGVSNNQNNCVPQTPTEKIDSSRQNLIRQAKNTSEKDFSNHSHNLKSNSHNVPQTISTKKNYCVSKTQLENASCSHDLFRKESKFASHSGYNHHNSIGVKVSQTPPEKIGSRAHLNSFRQEKNNVRKSQIDVSDVSVHKLEKLENFVDSHTVKKAQKVINSSPREHLFELEDSQRKNHSIYSYQNNSKNNRTQNNGNQNNYVQNISPLQTPPEKLNCYSGQKTVSQKKYNCQKSTSTQTPPQKLPSSSQNYSKIYNNEFNINNSHIKNLQIERRESQNLIQTVKRDSFQNNFDVPDKKIVRDGCAKMFPQTQPEIIYKTISLPFPKTLSTKLTVTFFRGLNDKTKPGEILPGIPKRVIEEIERHGVKVVINKQLTLIDGDDNPNFGESFQQKFLLNDYERIKMLYTVEKTSLEVEMKNRIEEHLIYNKRKCRKQFSQRIRLYKERLEYTFQQDLEEREMKEIKQRQLEYVERMKPRCKLTPLPNRSTYFSLKSISCQSYSRHKVIPKVRPKCTYTLWRK